MRVHALLSPVSGVRLARHYGGARIRSGSFIFLYFRSLVWLLPHGNE